MCLATLEGHAAPICALAASADGARWLSGGEDKTARVWDAHSGAQLHTLEGHTGTVRGVAFS